MTAAWAHESAPAAALSSGVRLEIVVPLSVLAALYAIGWLRLSRRARRFDARRPSFLLVGLAALAVALLSPLDALAEIAFSAHMVQHMLLIALAAPALLLADPFPFVVWALPAAARRHARGFVGRASPAGRAWRVVTALAPAWLVFAVVVWGWHLPSAYDAALSRRWLHDLEHLSFFFAAVIFWWPIVRPAPRFRGGAAYPLRVVHLVLGAFQTGALGVLLTLAPVALYRGYAHPAALQDQAAGGIVMWAVGGLVDMLAVLIVVHQAFGAGPRRPDVVAERMIGS